MKDLTEELTEKITVIFVIIGTMAWCHYFDHMGLIKNSLTSLAFGAVAWVVLHFTTKMKITPRTINPFYISGMYIFLITGLNFSLKYLTS